MKNPKNARYPRKPAQPFGMPATPFDPRTGKFLDFDEGVFAVFTVVTEGHDLLLCTTRNDVNVLVAKPWALRRINYDGLTIDGVTYTTTDMGARSATDGVNPDEAHLITPTYVAGEKILGFKHHEHDKAECVVLADEIAGVGAGTDYLLEWEDMGSGRLWAVEPAA